MHMANTDTNAAFVERDTSCGRIRGIQDSDCMRFLGVRYATADRFAYAKPVERWEGTYDATEMGDSCPQFRTWFEHLENPQRLFYHKEFRQGIRFRYSEDCLNLNIFTPDTQGRRPVIVYIHGGGFNSGANCELPFDGTDLSRRNVVTVFANYRVGVLGYLTHDDILKDNGRDGNFGLDDQILALKWVKAHIDDFGGDPENITVMGQSAGAMSIQYMVLNKANQGLFKRAIMMSGAGLFPRFSLPRQAKDCHGYWRELMGMLNCTTLDELRKVDLKTLFQAAEDLRGRSSDTTYNTMPVIDGFHITGPVDELMKTPLPLDYMIGYTNADMFAPILAHIGNVFARANGGYRYFLDLDAPGDDNRAFHSSDLCYAFNRLKSSWRPYDMRDQEASDQLSQYIANFACTGDPNGSGLPVWKRKGVLCIRERGTKMGHPSMLKMARNFLRRKDPTA